MLIEILQHTPPWVFVLFFVLLGLGVVQLRPRVVSLARAVSIPIAMIVLSVFGVVSVFQTSLIAIFAWLVGMGLAIVLNRWWCYPKGVVFQPSSRTLSIPGSWMPLTLMMVIYFTKYGVAVVLARNSALLAVNSFIGCVSLVYGFISGIFFAGALLIWRTTRQ
jgi:hypothetical protein